jgi:hypothetical protein
MSAPRSTAADRLWHFDLSNLSHVPPDHPEIPPGFDGHPRAAYVSSLRTQTLAERVRFIHQVFGAPAISTFTEAASQGFLRSIPGFESADIIRRHPPHAFETAIGHLDRIRQHIQSTHKPDADDHLATFPPIKTAPREEYVSVAIHELSHQIYADESGALPAPWGKQYHLLMYAHDENYIHPELLSSLSTVDIVNATQRGIEFFRARNITPKFEKLDNAASNPLQQFLTQSGIQFQLAPPNNHRSNNAERVMRTWKGHFIGTMAVADPSFPIVQSARLLAHAECTLNLMRASRIAPHISAWEQLHGPFDFTKTPLAIPGMLVAIHEVPAVRDSWGPHGIRAFYVGPAFHHYRCYQCWLPSTQETRITDTLEWFPRNVTMPGASPIEELTAATRDLTSALQRISSAPESASWRQPLAQLQPNFLQNLKQLHDLFSPPADPNVPPVYELNASADQRVPDGPATRLRSEPSRNHIGFDEYFTQHASPHIPQHVTATLPLPPPIPPVDNFELPPPPPIAVPSVSTQSPSPSEQQTAPPFPAPVLAAIVPNAEPATPSAPIEQRVTPSSPSEKKSVSCTPPPRNRGWRSSSTPKKQRVTDSSAVRRVRANRPVRTIKRRRPPKPDDPDDIFFVVRPTADPATSRAGRRHAEPPPRRSASAFSAVALNKVFKDKETIPGNLHLLSAFSASVNAAGRNMKWTQLIKDPDADEWYGANADEWHRLLRDSEKLSQTLAFVPADTKPVTQKATYINLVATNKIKPPSTTPTKRIRATAGNGIEYPGQTSAETASLDTVKLLFNAVVSELDAKFMTIDIKDFYLKSKLLRKEYAWVSLKQIAPVIIEEYNLLSMAVNGKVLIEIYNGIYGLPQSGKLAKDKLTLELAKHGFTECEHTPCLFTHTTRNIKFTLVVDDFGVKYTDIADVHFLISVLKQHYDLHEDYSGNKYLGISLDWNYDAVIRSVALSLPGYVHNGLKAVNFTPSAKPVHSPGGFVRPQYGATTQLNDIDTSLSVSAEATKLIQKKLGIFNWYLRVTDPTFKVRFSQLGSEQAHATEQTEASVEYVLNYLYNYPNASLVFYASDMKLYVESDASYNSEPGATSRAGGVFFLGARTDNFVNAPVDETSVRIDAVVSAVSEAEYAAIFLNARKATVLRQTLKDLGYPQPPTPMSVDNKCAQGLANDTVKRRRSKAIDMRFHWIRDRVRQGQFIINWAPGTTNLADFFTKNLPVKQFQYMRLFFVKDIKIPKSRLSPATHVLPAA